MTASHGPAAPGEPGADRGAPAGRGFGRLAAALPAVVGGAVIGVTEVAIATSFAALIFSGPLGVHLPAAIGLMLFGGTAVLGILAWRSSVAGTIGSIQDVSAVILSIIAASIALQLPAREPETFLTVVLALSLTALLTGAVFLLLGARRLANVVRFVPYPVVAGFLAGTGWLLTTGAFSVVVDVPITWGMLTQLAAAPVAAKWLPAVGLAVALLVLSRRVSHPLLIPGALIVAVGVFYASLRLGGWTVAHAEEGGWLLGPLPQGALWQPWTLQAVTQADWSVILAQSGSMATLVLLATMGLLLNSSGIELALDADADLNHELRTAGVANLLVGLGGGLAGYHALAFTVLADKLRARRRLTGLVAAATCAAALVAGASALALVPRAVLGGLLVFIGLGLLVEWAYETWFTLPRLEYLIVVAILAVMALYGFMPGVGVGLGIAIVLFVATYSRTPIVKHVLTGATFQSNVERSPAQQVALREHGDQLLLLELEGFVFFGTANSLLERLTDRLENTELPPLRFLVLDFRRVSGLDSSAVISFTKLRRRLRGVGAVMVLANVPGTMGSRLERGGLVPGTDDDLHSAVDLDHAVQWCEDRLLPAQSHTSEPGHRYLVAALAVQAGELDVERLLEYLEPIEVPAGHVVIHEGDESDGFYFLAAGRLTVQMARDVGPPIRLREMGPGAVVGELSHYLDIRRSAGVIATEASTVYRLTRDALADMERSDPQLAAALHRLFARLLAQRLVDSQKTVKALLD